MNRDIPQILARLTHVALTPFERGGVKAHLAAHIAKSPVILPAAARLPRGARVLTPITSLLNWSHTHMAPLTIGLIMALTAGGGVAFAAQSAVPGDTLYPVKVNIDERVETALAVTPKAKADVAVRLADERLKEATILEERNALSTSTKAELKTRVLTHLEKARKHVEELKAEGDDQAAADVETHVQASVNSHAHVAHDLNIETSTDAGDGAQGDDSELDF